MYAKGVVVIPDTLPSPILSPDKNTGHKRHAATGGSMSTPTTVPCREQRAGRDLSCHPPQTQGKTHSITIFPLPHFSRPSLPRQAMPGGVPYTMRVGNRERTRRLQDSSPASFLRPVQCATMTLMVLLVLVCGGNQRPFPGAPPPPLPYPHSSCYDTTCLLPQGSSSGRGGTRGSPDCGASRAAGFVAHRPARCSTSHSCLLRRGWAAKTAQGL